jgi:hypothetical protein
VALCWTFHSRCKERKLRKKSFDKFASCLQMFEMHTLNGVLRPVPVPVYVHTLPCQAAWLAGPGRPNSLTDE